MASGERITVTYAHPGKSANVESLKVDVYAFVPALDPVDPGPTFSTRNRLPFLLFLHGGHFVSGSRRDVPPWLASLARDTGMPLLAADYRLAPHAGPSDAFADIAQLWQFIVDDLNWIIACSGNGAEVESGNEMLEQDFDELQRRGGLDVNRGIIVGVGAGGYLAALGGALLSPPPLALVLGYPMLDIAKVASGYFVPASTPGHLRPLLNPDNVGKAAAALSSVPDMPMALDKTPYANDMRTRCGMDVREPWKGKEESVRRQGAIDFLLRDDRLDAMLRQASPDLILPSDVLLGTSPQQQQRNRPYPPTLIFHGLRDTRVSPDSSRRFIDVIRSAEPVAATMDALASGLATAPQARRRHQHAQPSFEQQQQDSTSTDNDATTSAALHCVPAAPNHTSRYLFLAIDGATAGHAFDALLPRELRMPPFTRNAPKTIGDRYNATLVHVERWLQHWLAEGSAERAAAQEKSRAEERKQQQQLGDDTGPNNIAVTADGLGTKPDDKGARIRVPVRGPRL